MAHSSYLWVDDQSGVDAPGWSFFQSHHAIFALRHTINAV
ncbi:hypothetical protein ACZ87_01615 [Candidatus Erwinia dacicola]|uniref:Uncharacterized protein n=1 Tax=Candidatus Erwinia dacicola TaxID=252393 RepID=A0A328TMG4_9GAMM|nr:hypothetical protein ACZ87_01615 [Candidatus Erwinia dacicola]